MNFEGNPFFWGFVEEKAMKTVAQRANAKYNKPREVVEQGKPIDAYFGEEFGHSPNIAHVIATEPIDPEPYLPLKPINKNTESDNPSDDCDEDNIVDGKTNDDDKIVDSDNTENTDEERSDDKSNDELSNEGENEVSKDEEIPSVDEP